MSALPAIFGNGPDYDDDQPDSELIAEELGLPHYHWLADCIADAMDSGDWQYVGHQCRKHLTRVIQRAEPEPQE